MNNNHASRGAVSIFVVIFAVLLITIITIGFTTIMLANQREATQNDLAQSAYDSAVAGVEDAKKLLLLNRRCIEEGLTTVGTVGCANIKQAIDQQECNTINQAYGSTSEEEVFVSTSSSPNDESLDQAYTCLKIQKDTNDYRRTGLQDGDSHVLPLRTAPGGQFDSITIEWFKASDAGFDATSMTVPTYKLGTNPGDLLLPEPGESNWSRLTPPILRASLIQMNNSFRLSEFNQSGGAGATNSSTLFMYPTTTDSVSALGFAGDTGVGAKAPYAARCDSQKLRTEGYICSAELRLPNPIGGDASSRIAFLRLGAVYNKTSYKVTLKNSGSTVRFFNVQPEVDVTGRANDMFRRVKARVQLDSDFPYPEAAVDITGNLCKDFVVSNNGADYTSFNTNSSTCTP